MSKNEKNMKPKIVWHEGQTTFKQLLEILELERIKHRNFIFFLFYIYFIYLDFREGMVTSFILDSDTSPDA